MYLLKANRATAETSVFEQREEKRKVNDACGMHIRIRIQHKKPHARNVARREILRTSEQRMSEGCAQVNSERKRSGVKSGWRCTN